MRVADYPIDAVHCRQLFRSALGVTAGHQNARFGIFAAHAANRLPHVVIRGGRHRAGVEHHQIGGRALARRLHSFGGQHGFERGAVRLGRPAAEVLYEECPHLIRLYGARDLAADNCRRDTCTGLAAWKNADTPLPIAARPEQAALTSGR